MKVKISNPYKFNKKHMLNQYGVSIRLHSVWEQAIQKILSGKDKIGHVDFIIMVELYLLIG